MRTLKPIVLSIVAITALLVFLRVVELNVGKRAEGEKVSDATHTSATLAMPTKTSLVIRSAGHDLDPPPPVIQDKSEFIAASPANTEADQLRPVLPPELISIVELETHPPEFAFSVLSPMLSHGDPVVRLAAIEALGDMTYPAAVPALIHALQNPQPRLRIAALEALALHETESVGSSIEPYLNDRDQEVRLAAIEALMDLELESTVPALAGLLSDPNRLIRHRAVNALGEIGGELSNQYLEQMRYDPNPSVRISVLAILDR